MFKKIIYFGITVLAVIVGFVLANPHHGGHPGLNIPLPPIPTVKINTGGLFALLRNPPIPIVEVPPLQLPNLPIPMLSFSTSGHHGGPHGHGLSLPQLPIGDILNSIIGGGHSSWDSWA